MVLWLDGFDYAAAFLQWECRKTPGRGNDFIVELTGDCPFVKKDVIPFLNRIPESVLALIHGKIRRNPFHAAPYWKPGKPLPVQIGTADSPEEYLNRPLPSNTMLECAVCGNSLLFKFGHILFDGHGAELFLNALAENDQDSLLKISAMDSPKLNEWNAQFSAGQAFQHKLTGFAGLGSIAGLPECPESSARFHVIRLSEEKTAALMQESMQTAGPFMETPFLMSKLVPELLTLLPEGNIMIPMSVDTRTDQDSPLYFNRWGILPVFAERKNLVSAKDTLAAFRSAILREIADHTVANVRRASRLTRIAPFPFMHRLAGKFGRVVTGSLMFSRIPESFFRPAEFAGVPIQNLTHYPVMPVFSGLGFFINTFRGQMNITLSFRDGVIQNPEQMILSLERILK